MRKITAATTAALLGTTAMAHAVGLDRSGLSIDPLFETGNYVELSFARTFPSVDGNDEPVFGGRASGNVADDFNTAALSFKYDINDKVSAALIIDQPYGANINYPAATATANSVALGGTMANVDSTAVTAIGRYKVSDRFSVHGGLRYQQISADVTLSGAAYGGLTGYNANFESDEAWGYLIGGAYEIPEIALRVALTYNSKIDHDLQTRETVNGVPVNLINPLLGPTSVTRVSSPESLNLDFQTGVAENTLVFGGIRYARFEQTTVSPVFFDAAVDPAIPGTSLTSIEDNYEVTLGVGRRFTDKISGSIAVGYEPEGEDDLVSPLAPTNGKVSLALGGKYDVTEQLSISGGVQYTWLGDARPETGTPDVARANFNDNNAVSVGFRVGYHF